LPDGERLPFALLDKDNREGRELLSLNQVAAIPQPVGGDGDRGAVEFGDLGKGVELIAHLDLFCEVLRSKVDLSRSLGKRDRLQH
jgi:hypothetical protein